MIKTWRQRCEEHPDHNGIVSEGMIQARMQEEIDELRDALAQAQPYKRLYELRGKALERPCSNCGHHPAKIKTMAQQAQEPMAWMYQGIRHDGTPHESPSLIWKPEYMDWMSASKGAQAVPLYTAPRQWQGLTADEIWDAWCEQAKPERDTRNFVAAFARAIEGKLREKNHG